MAEAYPDLKANQNMMQLSEELTTTENKVAFARQAFNDAVMAYNNQREMFPDSIFAHVRLRAGHAARDRQAGGARGAEGLFHLNRAGHAVARAAEALCRMNFFEHQEARAASRAG